MRLLATASSELDAPFGGVDLLESTPRGWRYPLGAFVTVAIELPRAPPLGSPANISAFVAHFFAWFNEDADLQQVHRVALRPGLRQRRDRAKMFDDVRSTRRGYPQKSRDVQAGCVA